MGPQLFSFGNFGADAAEADLVISSFNGAAAFQLRKYLLRDLFRWPGGRFNGAAAFQLRK